MDSQARDGARIEALDRLAGFRSALYRCLIVRGDELFELIDAVLCAGGPVTSLPELSLCGVHRRGDGAMYAALACGRVEFARLRMTVAGLELPRDASGRLRLAVDVTTWPRPDAATLGCAGNGGCDDILIVTWPQRGSMMWNE